MYLNHFEINEAPFSLTPDTSYFYRSDNVQAALNVVQVALDNGEGIIKITGEVGTGKTILCRKLLGLLVERYEVAYLPHPYLTPEELFLAIADEFQIPYERTQGLQRLLNLILRKLMVLAGEGRKAVIMVDEAQALPDPTLEALRLLTNLETEKEKILQVVLFGQPELDQRLTRPELRALRQRITFAHAMEPFTLEEMTAYVDHRLQVAGWNRPSLFSRAALELLHHASGGVARVVNILCHKTLMAGYGLGDRLLTPAHVQMAIADSPGLVVLPVATVHPRRPAEVAPRQRGWRRLLPWNRWGGSSQRHRGLEEPALVVPQAKGGLPPAAGPWGQRAGVPGG